MRTALLLVMALPLSAHADDKRPEPVGCKFARTALRLHEAYNAQVAAAEAEAAAKSLATLREAVELTCRGNYNDGATVTYPNGKTATASYATAGATVYYPTGSTLTASQGTTGATYYWPNGKTLSASMGSESATYYWPNGTTLTASIGTVGATWYYPNGKTISSSFGWAGATWYRPDGSTWLSSGPAIDKTLLLDQPGCLAGLALAGKLPDANSCQRHGKRGDPKGGDIDKVLAACETLYGDDDARVLDCVRDAAKRGR